MIFVTDPLARATTLNLNCRLRPGDELVEQSEPVALVYSGGSADVMDANEICLTGQRRDTSRFHEVVARQGGPTALPRNLSRSGDEHPIEGGTPS